MVMNYKKKIALLR